MEYVAGSHGERTSEAGAPGTDAECSFDSLVSAKQNEVSIRILSRFILIFCPHSQVRLVHNSTGTYITSLSTNLAQTGTNPTWDGKPRHSRSEVGQTLRSASTTTDFSHAAKHARSAMSFSYAAKHAHERPRNAAGSRSSSKTDNSAAGSEHDTDVPVWLSKYPRNVLSFVQSHAWTRVRSC